MPQRPRTRRRRVTDRGWRLTCCPASQAAEPPEKRTTGSNVTCPPRPGGCNRPGKTKTAPKGAVLLATGGGGRNRTGVHGFAGRCITTLPPRQVTCCWIVSAFSPGCRSASTRHAAVRRSTQTKREALLPSGIGAGDESRTRDLNLGKVALYQLSYSRIQLLLPAPHRMTALPDLI
ncbi:hypothetical protein CBM2589_B200019 [Cupriavidus taiwanensis]|uniref:Uncharacterized protein n=1 Tax=Cupriavidus taiwanensis TaxID=164546 RepID=A0A375BLU8_9BURK|nr:hypothetical protein CBM2589_B200019 [Cupriavidus taiwanensis]